MVKRIAIRGDGSWNESPTGAWVSSREYDKLEAALRKVDDWFKGPRIVAMGAESTSAVSKL